MSRSNESDMPAKVGNPAYTVRSKFRGSSALYVSKTPPIDGEADRSRGAGQPVQAGELRSERDMLSLPVHPPLEVRSTRSFSDTTEQTSGAEERIARNSTAGYAVYGTVMRLQVLPP